MELKVTVMVLESDDYVLNSAGVLPTSLQTLKNYKKWSRLKSRE
jgi:hypothetical protein